MALKAQKILPKGIVIDEAYIKLALVEVSKEGGVILRATTYASEAARKDNVVDNILEINDYRVEDPVLLKQILDLCYPVLKQFVPGSVDA